MTDEQHATGTLRLLILEDSEADAELLVLSLERSGFSVTAERVDSRDAFSRALRASSHDVIISDHALAQFDGHAAIRTARALQPTAPIVIVSGMSDQHSAVGFLREGAEDLVPKSDLGRLAGLVRSALAVREPLRRLSPRQVEVLRLVAEGHTTPEIAERLRLSVKTVEAHRGEIMKRTGIHDLVGLVRYAVRVGLVPVE